MNNATKYLIVLIFALGFKSGFAYNEIDSLENLLLLQKNDSDKVTLLLELTKVVGPSDTTKQSGYILKIEKITSSSTDIRFKSNCYFLMGSYFYRANRFPRAIQYFNKAYELYDLLENYPKMAEVLVKIGRMYYGQGNYVESLKTYYESLKIYEDNKIVNKDLGWLYRYMGSVFKRQESYTAALDHYEKALKIFTEVKNLDGIVSSYNNLGIVYGLLGEIDKELDYYRKALEQSRIIKDYSRTPIILSNIGQKLQMKGEYEKALIHYREAFKLYKEEEKYSFMSSSTAHIGSVYYEQKKYRLATSQFKEAEKFALLSDKKRAIRLEYIYSNLSWVYDSLRNTKEALRYYKLHAVIKDSLSSTASVIAVGSLHAQFEAEKEQEKLKNLALEKKVVDQELALSKQKERMELYIVFFIIIISLLAIGYFVKRAKVQKRIAEINRLKQKMANIKKEQLEKQLVFKNRDLTNFALDISRKKEFTEDVLSRLKDFKSVSPQDIGNAVKTLTQFVKGQIDIDKNLIFLNENVEQVNSEFFDKLLNEYPVLTKNERLLCGLIRINLSNKEISIIRNITPKAVKMGKYRLKKSLGIPSEENLDSFLKSF